MVGSAGVHPHEQPMVVGKRAVGGHGADDGGVGRTDVHHQAGETGRHAESLGHVEGLLGVVAAAGE